MKFEFQNGSTIETVESSSRSIRSRIKGTTNCVMTEVVICNSEGCSNNTYGACKLSRIEIRDGECENFKEEEEEEE